MKLVSALVGITGSKPPPTTSLEGALASLLVDEIRIGISELIC
jgi:hypothetical protein